jgi:hypothetical protein
MSNQHLVHPFAIHLNLLTCGRLAAIRESTGMTQVTLVLQVTGIYIFDVAHSGRFASTLTSVAAGWWPDLSWI